MKTQKDRTKQKRTLQIGTAEVTDTSEDDYFYYYSVNNENKIIEDLTMKQHRHSFERKFKKYLNILLQSININSAIAHNFDAILNSLENELPEIYRISKEEYSLTDILSRTILELISHYKTFRTIMPSLSTKVVYSETFRKDKDILSMLTRVNIIQAILDGGCYETRIGYLDTYVAQFPERKLVFNKNIFLKRIRLYNLFSHFSPSLLTLSTNLEVSLMMKSGSLVNLFSKVRSSALPILEQLLGLRATDEERTVLSQYRRSGRFPRSYSSMSNGVTVIVLKDRGGPLMTHWFNIVGFVALRLLMEVYGGTSSLEYWRLEKAEGQERPDSPMKVNSIDVRHLQSAGYRGKIHTFDLRYFEKDEKPKGDDEKYFLNVMHNVFPTLYSRGPGFFIIVVHDENTLNELCNSLMIRLGSGSLVVCLNPESGLRDVDRFESALAEYLMFGTRSERVGANPPISPISIHELRLAFNDLVDGLSYLSMFVKRQDGSDLGSTDIHQFRLKMLTFAALIDHLWSKREEVAEPRTREEIIKVVKDIVENHKIEFEAPIASGPDNVRVVPDIAFNDVNGRRVCVEIETLVGSREPLKKIDESVWKYRDVIGEICDEVWIVLEPVTALIHFEELMNRLMNYSITDEQFKGRVKVKVLTIYSFREECVLRPYQVALRDLEEFGKELRRLLREFREKKGGDAHVRDD